MDLILDIMRYWTAIGFILYSYTHKRTSKVKGFIQILYGGPFIWAIFSIYVIGQAIKRKVLK